MNKFDQIKLNVINLDWIRFTAPVSTCSHNSFEKQSLMQVAAWTQNSQAERKKYLSVIYPTAKWILEALKITYIESFVSLFLLKQICYVPMIINPSTFSLLGKIHILCLFLCCVPCFIQCYFELRISLPLRRFSPKYKFLALNSVGFTL